MAKGIGFLCGNYVQTYDYEEEVKITDISIKNCEFNSAIGNESEVGFLIGFAELGNEYAKAQIKNIEVISKIEGSKIIGEEKVGGIIGFLVVDKRTQNDFKDINITDLRFAGTLKFKFLDRLSAGGIIGELSIGGYLDGGVV